MPGMGVKVKEKSRDLRNCVSWSVYSGAGCSGTNAVHPASPLPSQLAPSSAQFCSEHSFMSGLWSLYHLSLPAGV